MGESVKKFQLETERLIIREWREVDIEPFAAMNQDSRIMEFFPFVLTPEESLAMINIFCTKRQENNTLYLPLIEKDGGSFAGLVNLAPVAFEAHFTPAHEIGWRLAYDFWGKGYATEAAKKLIEYGFSKLQLDEIVSFTAIINKRSTAVMERLGMSYEGEFDHPGLDAENQLHRHALYRISRGRV